MVQQSLVALRSNACYLSKWSDAKSHFSGTIMTISKDRVKASPLPDSWKLKEIFATGVVLGGYLALMTVIFFWAMHDTDFFTVSITVWSALFEVWFH